MNNHKEIVKIVISYALFGYAWIYFSDMTVGWIFRDPDIMTKWAISKGLLFITTTSVFLYFLIFRLNSKVHQSMTALRESEERLHLLVKNSSDSLVIVNADGSQKYVSPAAERITGFPTSELEGRSLDTLIHPDDMKNVMAAWNEAVAHPEKTVTVQYRHIHKTRQWVFSEAIAQNFLNEPAIKGIIASVRDITERKQAEQTISENEQRLLTLINSTPDIICFKDGAGRWLEANAADLDLFSLTGVDYRGKTDAELADFTAPFYRQSFLACEATDEKAWQAGAVSRGEEIIPRCDGTTKIYDVIKVPIFETDGTRKSMMVLGRDITERKQAEKDLQNESIRRHIIFEQSPDGILIIDPQTKRFLEFNAAAHRQLGYSREEFAQLTLADVEVLETAEETESRIAGVISDGRADFETLQRTRDGELRNVHVTAQYIDIQGQSNYHCVWRDITDRKQAEEERKSLQKQLIQAQKMEAIGTLAGGIAHDFNNILGAIFGYTEMARDASPPGSSIANDLDKVLKASQRAATLVKQILTFSRQADTERILVEPVHMVKEAIKLLRPTLPSTITIRQQLDATTKPILADPTQIHQIVMNLCTNAFHAMEQTGGTLDIVLQDCNCSPQDTQHHPAVKPGQFVMLSVGDSGPGISPEIQEKIFDPYFTTKEVGKGTGMGLAIVHGIVTAYGGFVTCASELGKGAIFQVFFPVMEQSVAPETRPFDTIPTGKERILLIDDEDILAELGQAMLERLGYEVTVRTNSLEALTTFQNQPDRFDAVITDQTMPGMTGIDLARRILQIQPGIPVILCTGFSSLISEEQVKQLGIKGFLTKPMTKKALATALRKVLDDKLPS